MKKLFCLSALVLAACGIGFIIWQKRKKKPLTTPLGAVFLDGLKEPYREFLRTNYPKFLEQFDALRPEAAAAEVAVFSMLHAVNLTPEPSDRPGRGGLDFICRPCGRERFAVEVTTILAEKVEEKTYIPRTGDDDGGAFNMITFDQARKIDEKLKQIEKHDYKMPVVVAVCTLHERAQGPFGTLAAQWLLTSVPRIVTPLQGLGEASYQTTDLKDAIFTKYEGGKFVASHKSISAILLINISESLLTVTGILHQEPNFTFDFRNLPTVPFVRLRWPVLNGRIKPEWVRTGRPAHF